jgi:hypothetical protein
VTSSRPCGDVPSPAEASALGVPDNFPALDTRAAAGMYPFRACPDGSSPCRTVNGHGTSAAICSNIMNAASLAEGTVEKSAAKVSPGYLATVLVLMGVLPVVSIVVERSSAASAGAWDVTFRWFVFWAVGVRLLFAGLRQAIQPSFTARAIFHLASADAEVIVRELGFANICLGLTAAISGFVPGWRMGAALAGGLYFGIAGAMHVGKRPASPNEWIALVSDLVIFAVLAACFAQRLAT